MTACRTCELVERRDAGAAPPWDNIVRTPGWDVVHAFGTAVEGWTVLVVRRHITAIASLTDAEAGELGPLVRNVSRAIQAVVDCDKTYVAQFAEDPQHPHVHVHVIPRDRGLPDDQRGPRIFGQLGAPGHPCVPDAWMNEFAFEMRRHLSQLPGGTPETTPADALLDAASTEVPGFGQPSALG